MVPYTFNSLLKDKSFKAGKLIPFVGAGFSMIDENAPSWKMLIEQISSVYKLKKDPTLLDLSGNVLGQAEYLKNFWIKDKTKPKIQSVEEIVASILSPHPKHPDHLKPHQILLSNFDRIYTTNYDKYFEDVASYLKIEIQNIPSLPFTKSSSKKTHHLYLSRNPSSNRKPCNKVPSIHCRNHQNIRRLIKYHGDYRIPPSLILTETSYFQRLLDFDAKDILFASDALFYDFLFLGYGFEDISLKYTLQQLERTFETLGNTSYRKRPIRRPQYFILRTEIRPRNIHQDTAYNLCSFYMSDFLPSFSEGACHLDSFSPPTGRRHEICDDKGDLRFSSFSILYNCAESTKIDYCNCPDLTCTKFHLDRALLGKEDIVMKKSRSFRAQVLNEGYIKVLEQLIAV